MATTRFSLGWVLALGLALAACSGTGPQLIGTYPKDAHSTTYAPPPSGLRVTYTAYMELEVADLDADAKEAAVLAEVNGGYLVSANSWYSDGQKNTTLTLAVPAAQFDATHAGLLRLGRLVREDISSDRAHPGGQADEGGLFSGFTVQLHAARGFQWHWPAWSWNPAHTAEQAFGVFASIFTGLADLVIWGLVVVGPFGLMAWGAISLVKRARKH